MRVDRRLFRSRLAHRLFLAFVLCALVPIGIVGVLSYRSVSNQLVKQASDRLHQASKALGLSLYERLHFAETDLIAVSLAMQNDVEPGPESIFGKRLGRLELLPSDAVMADVAVGASDSSFDRRRRDLHLGKGKAILLPMKPDLDQPPVKLAIRLDPGDLASDMVVGELNRNYFWGLDGGNAVAEEAQFCVFGSSGLLIFGSFDGCDEAWSAIHATGDDSNDRPKEQIEFRVRSMAGEVFVAGSRNLFLGARFFSEDWLVVVCETRREVVLPIRRWRLVFPAVVALSLWVVLLMVIASIRKNIEPIDRLVEGTRHIARREFDYEVDIRTGDEFEDLGGAFNQMAAKLRQQFGALAATGKIHRAILSSLATSEIVEATASGVLDYFGCDLVTVMLIGEKGASVERSMMSRSASSLDQEDGVTISPGLRSELESVPMGSIIGHDLPRIPELTSVMGLAEMKSAAAVPIIIRGAVVGVVGFGFRESSELAEDDAEQFSMLADQFAVALSNAGMLEEIDNFSLGTLEALARAVDAKSPWTAGHSERVTRLSVAIGGEYGLDSFEIANLFRGAMLHDIGKLGISQAILDKRGRLDDDEFEVVRSHTSIGERILEPIGAFEEIIPLVTQHHERFDGSGYPAGLVGSAIDVKARILSVADVFDAMTSPRPYRDGVDPYEVLGLIRSQAGSEFDPEVVAALCRVIDNLGGPENLGLLELKVSLFSRCDADGGWSPGGPWIGGLN